MKNCHWLLLSLFVLSAPLACRSRDYSANSSGVASSSPADHAEEIKASLSTTFNAYDQTVEFDGTWAVAQVVTISGTEQNPPFYVVLHNKKNLWQVVGGREGGQLSAWNVNTIKAKGVPHAQAVKLFDALNRTLPASDTAKE